MFMLKAFCVLRMRKEFFIFDQLYVKTHLSSGDGKSVIFLSFDSFFMLCEQFCPGRNFLTIFTRKGNLKQKPINTPKVTSILPIFVGTISKCVLYCSKYQHIKFHTCMKTAQFCHLPLYWKVSKFLCHESNSQKIVLMLGITELENDFIF